MKKLPQEFLDSFENDFGKENLKKYIDSFEKESIKGIRFHKIVPDFCSDLEKIPYFENSYYIDSDQKLGNTVLHQAGFFYIQEPSSMIPVASVNNLDFNNKTVLDLCASPGGKSTQISQLMNGTGILVSNEIDYSRAKTLFSNIERLGIENCVITSESPQNLAKNFQNTFDYIFVDAPCSGEGMFRKDNDAIDEWNASLPVFNHTRQLEILLSADKMLKDGGIIVYSTCTFNTVENEQTVDVFCKECDYKIEKTNQSVLPFTHEGKVINNNNNLIDTRHFFPFIAKGEGQFVAVLKKISSNENQPKKAKNKSLQPTKQEVLLVQKTLNENTNLQVDNYSFFKIQNKICMIKNCDLELENLNVLSVGAIVGEIVKNRLEFHHQFFKVFGKYFSNIINLKLDSEFVKKYMAGEQLDLDKIKCSSDILTCQIQKNGYGILQVDGVNVGGIKVVDNQLKNHYPKALRINNLK